MMRRIQGLLAGAAFALYAAVGVAAFAQAGPGPGGSPPQGGPPMMRGAMSASDIAQRLRDALQLRPAQEGALQVYASAIATAHQGMMQDMADFGPMPQTTPERLARMQQMMARRETAFAAIAEATRRFYDQLGRRKSGRSTPWRRA